MNDIRRDYRKISYYTPAEILLKASENNILASLLLTWAGTFVNAYGHFVNNRIIEDYVLIYCVDGAGWLKINDKKWAITAGDIFICPPNIAHSYAADEVNPWTKYWIHFRGSNASNYIELLGVTEDSPILNIGNNIKIIAWFQDIFSVLKLGYTQNNLFLATSYLTNILCYLNSLRANSIINRNGNINIEKIILYMIDNLNQVLTLEEMAEYANVSKYYLAHIFKDKTGDTPIDYYIRLKIQKACELLEMPDMRVNMISSLLGFSSPYYFSKVFKRIMGESPLYYRERIAIIKGTTTPSTTEDT